MTATFFTTLGVPLLEGRMLTPREVAEGASLAVVDRTMAERYWRGGDALGRRFRVARRDGRNEWRTVIGIVAPFATNDLDAPPGPTAFVPLPQSDARGIGFLVRTGGCFSRRRRALS